MDAQADLRLTSLSTVKGYFHVTTVILRCFLPLFIDNLFSLVFFVYCIFLFSFSLFVIRVCL